MEEALSGSRMAAVKRMFCRSISALPGLRWARQMESNEREDANVCL